LYTNQKLTMPLSVTQECLQFKYLVPFNNKMLHEKDQKKFQQHLLQCRSCHQKSVQFQVALLKLDAVIPQAQLDHDGKLELNQEFKKISEFVWQSLGDEFLPRKTRWFKTLWSLEKELTKIIFSKEMIKYYMISILLGLTLKVIL
jgi:hypothetical protein